MTNFFSKQALLTSALLLFFAFWGSAFAQTTDDYRNIGNVTFASPTNWQRYNGTSWVAATVAPTSANGKILITGANFIAQVTNNVTLDQITVDGTLQVNSGVTLTLADGAGDDLFVRNRLFFQATGVIAGAGQLVLGNQAIVQTANVNGVAGSITSTNPILTAGASYWFNGTAAQITGFIGFANLGNPLHFHFKNTTGITIDRNLTITGTLTADNNVPITTSVGVTSFVAHAIYNGGTFTVGTGLLNITATTIYNRDTFNNCAGATITPAFTDVNWRTKGIYQSSNSSEPTIESSNIWTNSHKTTVHMYWLKSGSGNNRIVVLKAGSPVNPNAAVDNTNYTANTVFGSGTSIDGGFVVYNGAGSQVDVTGLTEGVTYYAAVFEYNLSCTSNRNYKTGTPLTTSFVTSERPFITEWITTDGKLTIPTFLGETYNYTVSYRQLPSGVPTILTNRTGSVTLTGLTNNVTYEVSITGVFPRIHFGSSTFDNNLGSRIRNIKQWGSIQWTSMEKAFGDNFNSKWCINLNSNATDVPNLSKVNSMESMFAFAYVFNGNNIGNWNTQNVSNMTKVFYAARSFNQPIDSWNTQNVTTMRFMFLDTREFNQPIGNWNTQNVQDMFLIFNGATAFNQPIGNWNTQNVADMGNMFKGATSFNQPIGSWNTQNTGSMSSMFDRATSFNQPIGSWNTQNVEGLSDMFSVATSFNQPIGNWNIQNVRYISNMFAEAISFNQPIDSWNTQNLSNLSSLFSRATSFNQPIGSWNTQNVTTMSAMFLGATSFNQAIGNWNTANVTNMSQMFSGATSFNQSLANWNVTNLVSGIYTGTYRILNNCGLNKANYDATLIGWAAQNVKSGVELGADGLKYCAGQTARTTLISKGWTIIGDTFDCTLSISGNSFADMDDNCTKEVGEINLKGLVVKASPGDYYTMTDANGNYKIGVPTAGTYQVELLLQNPIGSTHTITAVCPPKPAVISASTPNITGIDFGAKAKVCAQLSVTVNIDRFRRCFEGNTYINYKNVGLLAANDVVVKVELPADIEAVSSEPAWTSQVGNILTYELNTLEGQNEGAIKLLHKVSCADESIRNTARCIKATISPATYCTPLVSPTWDNADLTVSSTCIDKRLGRFTIKNVGTGNMTDSSNYRIFFNEVIVKTGKVKLQANQETLIDVTHSGQVVRIEVEQTPQHPTGTSAMTFLNRCGDVALSSAFIQALPKLDSVSTGSACATILDSYDPNDKQIMPAGVTAQKIVEKDQELEFQIRFQNEGNDDAYKVVVRDTLDQNLDLATIRTISTSHNSTVSMEGAGRGVVIWTFNNINLPAKSVNEAASIGMITFRIRMKPNLPVGTVIKNKGHIYFDFNSAIITNETVIKIGSLPTDFGNPAVATTIFPCPANPSVAVAGVNQNISTTNTTLAATPVVKGYGKWSVVQGTATFSDVLNPTATVTNLSTGLNILKWTSYLCNNTSESQVQITVGAACPTISLTPATLNNGTVGTNYSQTISQTGGIGALTYSISAGTLPNGLSLNGATGVISGTPTVANTFNFTVQAKDVNNCVGTKIYTVVIEVAPCPTISLTPATLNNGTVGTNYSQTVTQTGGVGAITYSISAGTLPNGLTLNASTGEISGTPTVANTFNFTVQAKDVNNCVGTKAYSVVVASAPVPPPPPVVLAQIINFEAITDKLFGEADFQLVAKASSNLPVTFEVVSGNVMLFGNMVKITGVGSVTIRASQKGNAQYSAATPVLRTFIVNKASQTLSFNAIDDRIWNLGNFNLTASASSSLPITYEVTTGQNIAKVTGSIVELLPAVGTVTITARQIGNDNYHAMSVSRTFNVLKVPQSQHIITVTNSPLQAAYGSKASFSVFANSNLPVKVEVIEGSAMINGNQLEFTRAGVVKLRFIQEGNELWEKATSVERRIIVHQLSQSIEASVPSELTIESLGTIVAKSSSGLPVSMQLVSGQAQVNGFTLVPTGGSSITIELSQAGNENYEAAPILRFVIGVKPTLQIKNISSLAICADNSLSFDYEIKGELPNQFNYFLSDSKGDFSNQTLLEGVINPQTKKVSVKLPASLGGSSQYRLKIATSSIESNILQFTVNELPNKPIIRQEGEFLVVATQDKVQWYHAGLPIQQTGNKYKPMNEQLDKKNEFHVVVQNDKGCLNISEIFRNYVKPVPTGVNDEELSAKMLFYPNPTQDDLTISLTLENMKDVDIQLVDVMGRTVFERKVAVSDVNFSHTISLQDYAGGVYLLFVKVNDRVAVKKIVKQ